MLARMTIGRGGRGGSVLGLAVILQLVWTCPPLLAADTPVWFRGQLHSHTYWSDGRGFPEQAVRAHKERGYQFLAISDHNRFADDKNTWREVAGEEGPWPPKATRPIFDAYLQAVGRDSAETKTEGGKTFVRLKTFAELQKQYEEPGRFLLLPGVELTQTVQGRAVHTNCINLPELLPCVRNSELIKNVTAVKTVRELIALNAAEAKQAAAAASRPYLLTLNHPFWVYYDVVAQDLVACPEVRFFEVCNGGADYAPYPQAASYTPEKFWDVVNAFRCDAGQSPLYGIGSDDSHFYDAQRIDGVCGVGDAWIMVRAATLTPDNLIAAMQRGDFYASTGVFLEQLVFTPDRNTLHVKVKAEPGVHYRIHFIATKRGFSRDVSLVTSPAEKDRPTRSVPVYSDDIGRTVQTLDGVEAAYTMQPDDLYVRARIESDRPSQYEHHFHPKHRTAWTQPYSAAGH